MKKLFYILIISILVFGCKAADDLNDSGGKKFASAETSGTGNESPGDEAGTTEETATGGESDWNTQVNETIYNTLTGKIEAGPANLLGSVGAMSVDSSLLMTGYVPGYIADNDGSYVIRGTFSGTYRYYEFYGTAYSEGKGDNIDGVSLKMFQTASATEHNINNGTTLRFVLAMKHYDTVGDPNYQDIPGSFIAAKNEIYSYLGFPNANKNFYEYSVMGDATGDAYLFRFETLVTADRDGYDISDYIGKFANAIYENDLTFKSELAAANQTLKIKKAYDDLKAEMVLRGFEEDPAPIWLTDDDYYIDLMPRVIAGTVNVLESHNLSETSTSAIDISTKKQFAYPIEGNLSTAKYLAAELTGDVSIYTVSTCNNGVMDFPCPGTDLTGVIEKFRETLLPDPLDLSFNGQIDSYGLTNGQFFLVEEFDTAQAVSHTSTGSRVSFGWNLATTGDDWNNAVCVNNNALPWCFREIKWGTAD